MSTVVAIFNGAESLTLKAHLLDKDDNSKVWDGSSFVSISGLTDAEIEAALIDLVELRSDTDDSFICYTLTIPSGVTGADYRIYKISGAYSVGQAALYAGKYQANVGLTASEVWTSSERTLTTSATPAGDDDIVDYDFTFYRGDYISQAITGLGDLSSATKLQFTIKRNDDADDTSIIQIEYDFDTEVTTVTYIEGTISGETDIATITIDDEVAGDITIEIEAEASQQFGTGKQRYDIQVMLTATRPVTRASGYIFIYKDTTRKIT